MLILSANFNEQIELRYGDVTVVIVLQRHAAQDTLRLGFDAPQSVAIRRVKLNPKEGTSHDRTD